MNRSINAISSLAGDLIERPVIKKQHPLALKGRYLHPSDMREWTLPEAIAWVQTRDLGLVAGVSACLAESDVPFHQLAARALELLERSPYWTADENRPSDADRSKFFPPEEVLRHLLSKGKVAATGRRAAESGGPVQRIPTKDWEEGSFSMEAGGSWKGADPLLKVHWQDLRIERGALQVNLPTPDLPQELPGHGTWLPLVDGLMWIAFRHAVPLLRLRTLAATQDGPSLEHYRKQLQVTLQGALSLLRTEIANGRNENSLRIKGSPLHGETIGCEQLLMPDQLDLATCLEWITVPGSGEIAAALLETAGPDRYSLVPARLRGYANIHLHRGDLMALYEPRDVAPQPEKRRHASSGASDGESLEAWLGRMFVRFQDARMPSRILKQQARKRYGCSKEVLKRAWNPPEHLRKIWSKPGPKDNRAYLDSEFD